MNKEMQYQVECLASDLTEMLMSEYGWDMLKALDVNEINAALNLLLETFEGGNTVFVFGNGGSSATACIIKERYMSSHF